MYQIQCKCNTSWNLIFVIKQKVIKTCTYNIPTLKWFFGTCNSLEKFNDDFLAHRQKSVEFVQNKYILYIGDLVPTLIRYKLLQVTYSNQNVVFPPYT